MKQLLLIIILISLPLSSCDFGSESTKKNNTNDNYIISFNVNNEEISFFGGKASSDINYPFGFILEVQTHTAGMSYSTYIYGAEEGKDYFEGTSINIALDTGIPTNGTHSGYIDYYLDYYNRVYYRFYTNITITYYNNDKGRIEGKVHYMKAGLFNNSTGTVSDRNQITITDFYFNAKMEGKSFMTE